jgi:hypothetical protein
MTTEDQDAEVGRLVRERRDLKAKKETLVSVAHKHSAILSGVGKALNVERPGHRSESEITFRVEPDGSITVSDEYHPQQLLRGQFPTLAELQQLLSDISKANERLGEIENHLKGLGL